MKRKVKRAALEWDDFVLREQLESLMYADRSLRGDPMKDKFIDELNFKNFLRLSRNKTSKLFVGITSKKIKFIIHPKFFDAKNIISDPFIHNLKRKPSMFHDLSIQMNISLKRDIVEQCQTSNTPNHTNY